MQKQMYDVDISKEYGIIPAVILDSIRRWVEYHETNGTNFHDGDYWAYNTKEAWAKQFPDFTKDQVRRALDKLREAELVKTGNYNKAGFDRTIWYALTDKARNILYGDLAKLPNGFGKNAQCNVANLPNGIGTDARTIPSKYTSKKPSNSNKPKGFIPPSIQEVREYIASKGYNVDADKFVEYYASNEWKDAKDKPVKNWKQRVVSWADGRNKTNKTQPQPINPASKVDMSKYNTENIEKDTTNFFDEL